jgi:hypothetical protein
LDKLLESLVANADKLGTVATLLLFILGMGWALVKEKLVLGSRYADIVQTAKESASALVAANKELDLVRDQLIRLQVEKEYTWKQLNTNTREAR